MLPEVFRFIAENWQLLAKTFNDRDNNLPEYLFCDEHCYHPDGAVSWSCCFAQDLILDLYGHYSKEAPELDDITVTDLQQLDADFVPGYIYAFSVTDHYFTIIYEKDIIYFIDFHDEINREENNGPFCFKVVTREELMKVFESYISKDIVFFIQFLSCFSIKEENIVRRVEYYQDKYDKLAYKKYPINKELSVKSILDTIKSRPLQRLQLGGVKPKYRQEYLDQYSLYITALDTAAQRY